MPKTVHLITLKKIFYSSRDYLKALIRHIPLENLEIFIDFSIRETNDIYFQKMFIFVSI